MKPYLPLLLLALAGCADTTEPGEDRDLRFELERIDGKNLPQVAADGSLARIVFTGGALHLYESGIFFDSTHLRVTTKLDGKTVEKIDVATGIYTTSGDTLFFRSVNRPGEHYLMIHISERALEQKLGSAVLLYAR